MSKMLICRICGYSHLTMISSSHLKKHNITGKEYKIKFPGEILRIQSDESKLKSSNSKKGKTSWNKGLQTGPNKKLSESTIGKPKLSLRGLKRTAEQRALISKNTKLGMVGKMTDEVKAKISNKIQKNKIEGTYIPGMLGKTLSEESKDKISKSLVIKNAIKSKLVLEEFEKTALEENILFLSVEDNYWINMQCEKCNTKFTFSRQIFRSSTKDGKQICPTCNPRLTGKSLLEQEVFDFVKSLNSTAIANDRHALSGKEIDVFIPELKLGFEFTGLYWHSEKQNPENKHLLWKTQFASKLGIQIITIFEDEWLNKKDIVKSRIAGMLNKHSHSIFARKCLIKNVSSSDKIAFLNDNHLQGKDTSSACLGLYFNNELVALASFKKTNISKGGDGSMWELSRFCSKINTRISGGASKLIKYFQNNINTENLPLLSYADRRWSSGKLYKQLGFTFSGTSTPSYWYMSNYKTRLHRSNFMKHKLVKSDSDNNLTEWELAKRQGLDRIWDCGTTKWILNK